MRHTSEGWYLLVIAISPFVISTEPSDERSQADPSPRSTCHAAKIQDRPSP